MLGKIVLTLLLLIGVFKPMVSIKLFEFWKLGRGQVTQNALIATRIMSIIAIVLIWVLI